MFALKSKGQKWRILLGMTSCISMIFLDITVLPVALPTIQRSLDLSNIGLTWIVNAYLLTLTLFVVAGGRLSDRIGHKWTFLVGLLLFALSSALCGFASQQAFFVAARAVQGCGAALMIPSAMSITFQTFPENARGKASGLIVSVGSIFLTLGPFIGGLFSEYFSWRYIFWINLPIALVGFLLTYFSVPSSEIQKRHFDSIGFVLSTLGISCLVVPLMSVNIWGWASPLTISLLVIGILLIFFLMLVDRRIEDPFLNFTFFKSTRFSGAVIAIFTIQFILMITVFWALYFQNVFHYTPLQAGSITMAAQLPIILLAPVAGHLVDRYGPFLPVALGLIFISGALFWFLQHVEHRNLLTLMGTIIPFGCGIPLIFTPCMTSALHSAGSEQWGLASGMITMLRQLGGTLGLALISSLFFSVQQTHFAGDLKMHKETIALNPSQFDGLLAQAPPAMRALNALKPSTQTFVEQAYTNAYIDAFWTILLFALIAVVIGLSCSLFFLKGKRS